MALRAIYILFEIPLFFDSPCRYVSWFVLLSVRLHIKIKIEKTPTPFYHCETSITCLLETLFLVWTLWHCPGPASLSDTASWDQAWDTWPLSSGNQWTSSSWTIRSWWMWTVTVPDGYVAVSHTSRHLCSSVLSISLILAVWYFIQFWDGTSGRVWLYDNFIVMRLMLWDYQKYNLCVIYVDNTVACPKSPAGTYN